MGSGGGCSSIRRFREIGEPRIRAMTDRAGLRPCASTRVGGLYAGGTDKAANLFDASGIIGRIERLRMSLRHFRSMSKTPM